MRGLKCQGRVLRVEALGKRVEGRGLTCWVNALEGKGQSVSVRGLTCLGTRVRALG